MFALIHRLILAALVLLLTSPASAQVINGCVKDNNGALRIVSDPADCTSRETPISWNQVGPAGEPGQDGVDGAPGTDGTDAEVLHVFDRTGRDLGLYVGTHSPGYEFDIYFKEIGAIGGFGINSGFPTLQIAGSVFWESTDCTGQAYSSRPSRLFIVSKPGVSVYVATCSELVTIHPRSIAGTFLPSAAECSTGIDPDPLIVTHLDLIDPVVDIGVPFPFQGPLYLGPAPEVGP